jgi:hypothetical protein
VNGHSLLGVKLSEAQSYLIKSSDYVHMIICDGFNTTRRSLQPQPQSQSQSVTPTKMNEQLINDHKTKIPSPIVKTSEPSQPPPSFPRLSQPPQPAARQSVNIYDQQKQDEIDNQKPLISSQKPKLIIETNSPLSNCNYDNLTSVNEDDSSLNKNVQLSSITTPQHISGGIKGNSFHEANHRLITNDDDDNRNELTESPIQPATTTTTTINNLNNKSTPINTNKVINSIQQQQTSSLPLPVIVNDKNLMNNIMNKTNNNDFKSQSMFTANNTTPVGVVIILKF